MDYYNWRVKAKEAYQRKKQNEPFILFSGHSKQPISTSEDNEILTAKALNELMRICNERELAAFLELERRYRNGELGA